MSKQRRNLYFKDGIALTDVSSTKIEGNFFSVAITTPLAATNMTHIFQNQ
jgi:hypothetical protein